MNESKAGKPDRAWATQEELPFLHLLNVLRRRKGWIIGPAAAVLCGAVLYLWRVEPIYEAKGLILIDLKQQTAPFSGLELLSGLSPNERLINNQIELLKSQQLALDVARRLREVFVHPRGDTLRILKPEERNALLKLLLRLRGSVRPQEGLLSELEVAERLQRQVRFQAARQADVISIVAQSPHSAEAALIVNTYIQAYQEYNLQASRARYQAARQFLEDQLRQSELALSGAETELELYMQRAGTVLLDEEAKRLIELSAQAQADLSKLEVELNGLRTQLRNYQRQLEQYEPEAARLLTEASDPYIRTLSEQLARLEVERDQILARNPDARQQGVYNRELLQKEAEIQSLRRRLQERTASFVASILPGASASADGGGTASATGIIANLRRNILETDIQIQALEAKRRELLRVSEAYDRQLRSMPERSMVLARLQRNRLANEKIYLFLVEKYQEAQIAERSELGFVTVVDRAPVPLKPVKPRRQLVLLLSALLGLALGGVVAYGVDRLDRRIKTPEELRDRGHVVLGAIPFIASRKKSEKLGSFEVASNLVTLIAPLSPAAESYRRLRTALLYAQVDRPLRVLLVTSSMPKEGKTTTAANLAIVFAQNGQRALLIDADLRRPLVHEAFGLSRTPGLAELLTAQAAFEEVVRPGPLENLELLPSGSLPPNPADLLGSRSMREFVTRMRERYDVLILDSPPLGSVADAAILGAIADGIVLVGRFNYTPRDMLEKGREVLEEMRLRPLGVVLNAFDPRLAYGYYGKYGYYRYSGYYGYYYGYYEAYGENGASGKVKSRKA
ncbi:MAG: polysaccharide biosynthesis tyrosine autokinase [Bacteroidota bacterium]|nr:polysaccharide biosynthesis tyrosine autokinase [Bacteroidota bacterium]